MTDIIHVDFYSKDWLLHTQRLTLEERGVFIQVVAAIYQYQGAIDNDPQWLSNLCNCSTRKIKSILNNLIEKDFLIVIDGKITQKRAEKELENARKRRENAAKNGRKTSEIRPESNKNNEIGSTSHQSPVTSNKKNTSYSKKPTRLPEDWVCDVKLGEWAMDQGMARGEVVQEIEQFKDHYSAATGKGSTALDWDAKFRTWVRNSVKWKK